MEEQAVSTNIPVRRLPLNAELTRYIEWLAERIGTLENTGTTGMPDYADPTTLVNMSGSTEVDTLITAANVDRWISIKAEGYFNDQSENTFMSPIEILDGATNTVLAVLNNPATGGNVYKNGHYVPSFNFIFPLAAGFRAMLKGKFDSMTVVAYPAINGSASPAPIPQQSYVVTFMSGDTVYTTQSVYSGFAATEPADPTKAHYNFAYWCIDPECTTQYDFSTNVVGNVTLYAKWIEADKVAVYFESKGGSFIEDQIVYIGETATEPPVPPTKNHYDFSCWCSDADATIPFDFSTPITETTTLYAKWMAGQVTVSFNTNGGSNISPVSVTVGTTMTAPASPTKHGYVFTRWCTDADGLHEFNFSTPVEDTMTLYAMYVEAEKIAVTFNSNGGSSVATAYIYPGDTVSVPTAPTRNHYDFDCWCTDEEGTTPFDFSTPINVATTLYAKWLAGQVTVSFNTDGGSSVAPVSVTVGNTISQPATIPTKSGYVFAKWCTDQEGLNEFNFSTPITDDLTLYAKWTVVHTVTFSTDGGDVVAAQQIPDGGYVTRPADPSKTGEYFDGWFSDSSLTTAYVFSTPVTSSFVLYAKWIENPLAVPLGMTCSDGNVSVHLDKVGSPSMDPDLVYSVNNGAWTTFEPDVTYVTLTPSDKLQIRAGSSVVNTGFAETDGSNNYYRFKTSGSGKIALSGNIMMLLNSSNPSLTIPSDYCFYQLFNGATHISDISNLKLPATDLTTGCYMLMFAATGITFIPSDLLPATTLEESCYEKMFSGCTSLTSLPATLLHATILDTACYRGMFGYCSNLTSLPLGLLPATTLAAGCYMEMFWNCTGLTSVPSSLLPATTLVSSCYSRMFKACSLTVAPHLPATDASGTGAYQEMFQNCSNLNEVRCSLNAFYAGGGSSGSISSYNWLSGVSETGTFYCNATLKAWLENPTTRNANTVPLGWTNALLPNAAA